MTTRIQEAQPVPINDMMESTLETGLVYTNLGANHHMWTKARLNRATAHFDANTRYATFTWFGGFRGGAQVAFIDKDGYIVGTTHAEIHGVDGTRVGRSDWTVPWNEEISPEIVRATHHMIVVHYPAENWNDNLNKWLGVGKQIGGAIAEILLKFPNKAGSGT